MSVTAELYSGRDGGEHSASLVWMPPTWLPHGPQMV